MGFTDQFQSPHGLMGSLMLSGMNIGHGKMATWGFTQFEMPRSGVLLDIGCGGGANVKRMLEKSEDALVYGVDLSAASVEKSRKTVGRYLGERCEIFQGSAEQLPFDDGVVDLATAFETVYFWPDLTVCFREVHRILKEGGIFAVINDPGDQGKNWEDKIPGMTAYSAADIERLMLEAGFTEIKASSDKNSYCVIGTA